MLRLFLLVRVILFSLLLRLLLSSSSSGFVRCLASSFRGLAVVGSRSYSDFRFDRNPFLALLLLSTATSRLRLLFLLSTLRSFSRFFLLLLGILRRRPARRIFTSNYCRSSSFLLFFRSVRPTCDRSWSFGSRRGSGFGI